MAVPVAGVFMFIFHLGSASLIRRIPSSGMRRNFKPTSHSHLLPSSLSAPAELDGGLQREPAHELLAQLCQGHWGKVKARLERQMPGRRHRREGQEEGGR